MAQVIREFLESPFVFIDIVTQRDLAVDVVTKQIDMRLTLWASVERREFEQGFFDGAIVVDMDGILEHVVDEVGTWLDEVIDGRQHLEVLSLLLVEQIEFIFVLIQLHPVDRLLEVTPLLFDHLLSFLYLLLLLRELFDFFVDLFFHHLEQILVLDLQLVHDSPERLL